MASTQDLQAAIADLGNQLTGLQTSVAAEKAEIDALIAKLQAAGTIPDADIQSLLAISSAIGNIKTSVEGFVTPGV